MTTNKEIVRQMWEDISAGHRDKFFGKLDDNVVFTVTGTTSVSMVTHGKEEMIEKVISKISSHVVGGGLEIAIDNLIGEGEWVAMQSRGFGKGTNGITYNNQYAHFFRLRDGLVVEWTEYFDTALTSRLLND